MATASDVRQLLKDSGSILISSNSHLKFKLPNGRLFVIPKTGSDYRGCNNALAILRKELRVTHPNLASRGWSLPKYKRPGYANTIAEQLIKISPQLQTGISPEMAVPGMTHAAPAPVPELEVEVLDDTPVAALSPEETPEPVYHHVPRPQRKYPSLPPSKPRTLTSDQLARANEILRTNGEAAMNKFLNDTREGMIPAESAPSPEPIKSEPEPKKETAPIKAAVAPTGSIEEILNRAKAELQAVTTRLSGYTAQMQALREAEETDLLKQVQLEQYIQRCDALFNETITLMVEALPPVTKEEAPKEKAKEVRTKAASKKKIDRKAPWVAGYADLQAQVFPVLRGRKKKSFTTLDVMNIFLNFHPEQKLQSKYVSSMLFNMAKKEVSVIERVGPGIFAFRKKEATNATEE